MIKLDENLTCWNSGYFPFVITMHNQIITHGFHAQGVIFSLFKATNKKFSISF